MNRLILILLFPLFTLAQLAPITVPNMATLRTITPTGKPVFVEGYYSPGDGGGGWYALTNTTSGTNAYGGRVLALGGAKSWNLQFEGQISPLQFGAIRDDGVDDTIYVQAAISWAESHVSVPEISFPAGAYDISSITIKSVPLRGYGVGHSSSINALPRNAARLRHVVGATNDMITIMPTANPFPSVQGFELMGQRELNLKNPFTISSVASRTNFTVSSPGSLPAAPASPATFPYYGWCFFFSSENKYIGAGLVVGMNTGTGVIELAPGTDVYATRTGASLLLEPGQKVCFATDATETAPFKTTTGRDSTTAGYNAINIKATSATQLISDIHLEDLWIMNFHTGIRSGNVLLTTGNRLRAQSCSFAGWAAAFPGDSRDAMFDQNFWQGFYFGQGAAETQTFDNAIYRRTLFGIYGLESSGNLGQVSCDHTTYGILVQNCLETRVDSMLIDGPGMAGIVFAGGQTITDRPQSEWGQVMIRNSNESTLIPTTSNPFYAFDVWGVNSTAYIHGLSILQFGVSRYYTATFNVPFTTQLEVANVWSLDGATNRNLFSDSMVSYPKIINLRENQNQASTYIGGNKVWNITSNTITTPSSLLLSSNLTMLSSAVLSIGNGKQRFFGSGFEGFDSTAVFYTLGADQTTGTNRTDLASKGFRLRVPSATNADPDITAVVASSTVLGNSLVLGGIDPGAQPMQQVSIYTGPQGTGTGTNQFTISSTGAASFTGLVTANNGATVNGDLRVNSPQSKIITDSSDDNSGLLFQVAGANLFQVRFTDEFGNTSHTFYTNGVYRLPASGYIEYSSGGPRDGAGSGAPSASWPNGSTWRRTDGTGPNFYVRENGAWVAK